MHIPKIELSLMNNNNMRNRHTFAIPTLISSNAFLKAYMDAHQRTIEIRKIEITDDMKSTEGWRDFTKAYGVFLEGIEKPIMYIASGHETYPISRTEWIPVYRNGQMHACYGSTLIEACELGLKDACLHM